MDWLNENEDGHVLLSTFSYLTLVGVILALLAAGSNYILEIVFMQKQAQETYWLAKSQAIHVLNTLRKGEIVEPVETLHIDNMAGNSATITTETTQAQGTLMISVNAVVGQAEHTISFSFNPGTSRITNWLDSAVSPGGN